MEKELKEFTSAFSLNYLEYSILLYIAEHNPTQYAISKEYYISIQRVNQVIKKLKEKKYILLEEEIKSGRTLKKIILEKEICEKLEFCNYSLINNLKAKEVKKNDLRDLNNSLKNLLIKLS